MLRPRLRGGGRPGEDRGPGVHPRPPPEAHAQRDPEQAHAGGLGRVLVRHHHPGLRREVPGLSASPSRSLLPSLPRPLLPASYHKPPAQGQSLANSAPSIDFSSWCPPGSHQAGADGGRGPSARRDAPARARRTLSVHGHLSVRRDPSWRRAPPSPSHPSSRRDRPAPHLPGRPLHERHQAQGVLLEGPHPGAGPGAADPAAGHGPGHRRQVLAAVQAGRSSRGHGDGEEREGPPLPREPPGPGVRRGQPRSPQRAPRRPRAPLRGDPGDRGPRPDPGGSLFPGPGGGGEPGASLSSVRGGAPVLRVHPRVAAELRQPRRSRWISAPSHELRPWPRVRPPGALHAQPGPDACVRLPGGLAVPPELGASRHVHIPGPRRGQAGLRRPGLGVPAAGNLRAWTQRPASLRRLPPSFHPPRPHRFLPHKLEGRREPAAGLDQF